MKWKNKYLMGLISAGILLSSCKEEPVGSKAVPADSTALNYLVQSPAHMVLSQQSVIRFGDDLSTPPVKASGYIIPDERRTNDISARVNGRIEKLYVHFPYEYIHKGQKLMDIYSPELTNAISEYIFLYQKDSAGSLANESRLKLERMGLTSAQIREAERTHLAPLSIAVYSSYEGYSLPVSFSAMESQGAASSPAMGMQGMAGPENEMSISSSQVVREGSYFTIGQKLFSVNDAEIVIALLTIPSPASVQGSLVRLTSEIHPDSVVQGTVSMVEPAFRGSQKFLFGRVELKNSSGELKFNSLVNAEISSGQNKVPSVPASCVYDLGNRKIVWVKTGMADGVPVFVPRVVITGSAFNRQTEIISGLVPGDEIALEAGLLTDRESNIQPEVK